MGDDPSLFALTEAIVFKKTCVMMTVSAVFVSSAALAAARDYISIVGSSTVYPFSTVVAEQFGRNTTFKTPKVEATGSGGGLKLLCAGIGIKHPDVTNASRRIKASEQAKCAANGINDILEIKVGYDGIVLANAKQAPHLHLNRKVIFLALAKQVPGPDGKLIDNPYQTWQEIDPSLPDTRIEVLGPPPTSGTRDAFVELAMEGGAKQFADLKALRKSQDATEIKTLMTKLGVPDSVFNKKGKQVFKIIAHAIREDGVYIEAGENDNLILQKLAANPKAVGIFGYSFLDQNRDQVKGALVDGHMPEFELIASGDYPISRPLYFYVKLAHVGNVPGIEAFLAEFTADDTWGDEGYLTDKGLIPMPAAERATYAENAALLTPMPKLR